MGYISVFSLSSFPHSESKETPLETVTRENENPSDPHKTHNSLVLLAAIDGYENSSFVCLKIVGNNKYAPSPCQGASYRKSPFSCI
jgi:hypothetical protein